MLPLVSVPAAQQDRQTSCHRACVVHRLGSERHRKWEAIYDDPDGHVGARDNRNNVENRVGHGEGSSHDVAPSAEDVGNDESKVGQRRKDDKGSDEGAECGAAADIHTSNNCVQHRTYQCRIQWVSPFLINVSDPARKRRRIVSAESPQHTSRCDVASDVRSEGWKEDDEEEADRACLAIGSLAVEFGERKGPGVREKRGEVVHRIKDCDDVAEGSGEADDVLSQDGFGDVDAGEGDFFGHVGYAITMKRQYS